MTITHNDFTVRRPTKRLRLNDDAQGILELNEGAFFNERSRHFVALLRVSEGGVGFSCVGLTLKDAEAVVDALNTIIREEREAQSEEG